MMLIIKLRNIFLAIQIRQELKMSDIIVFSPLDSAYTA